MTLSLIFIFNFLLSILLLPVIIRVCNQKNIHAKTTSRSSHLKPTPNIGGIVFFLCLTFTISFSRDIWKQEHSHLLIPSLLIILILGLKDDITGTRPFFKLAVQIIACFFIIFKFTFPVIKMPYSNQNLILTYFVFPLFIIFIIILIINSINLIDGINTLAGQLCIFYLIILSVIFYQNNDMLFVSICISLISTILPFIYFNLQNKLFMGDTGSMLLGLILSICILRIATFPHYHIFSNYGIYKKIILLSSLISIPVLDLVRIFFVRILNKRSPFSSDKSHIHHILINMFQTSHFVTSLIITICNGLIFIFSIWALS